MNNPGMNNPWLNKPADHLVDYRFRVGTFVQRLYGVSSFGLVIRGGGVVELVNAAWREMIYAASSQRRPADLMTQLEEHALASLESGGNFPGDEPWNVLLRAAVDLLCKERLLGGR